MNLPKITAGKPTTHNRKFRRALRSISQERAQPGTGKRCRALLSNLVGGKRLPGHNALVTGFFAEL